MPTGPWPRRPLTASCRRSSPVRIRVAGTPVVAFLITGAISTVVLLIAAVFIKSQDSLYYAIFAASSVVFLLPYLLMFPAAVVLRIKDPDTMRPFRIPGGTKVVAALAAVATFVIAATALFFMWPEIPHRPADWSYTGPLLGIVAGALIIGEALIWRGMHSARPAKPPKAQPPKAPSPPASALPSAP